MSLMENSRFSLEEYFNGKTEALGLVMNRSGAVTRRFVVTINTSWSGVLGTLTEDFEWSDGEKTNRIWSVKKTGENTYSGTADDIIGVAQGTSSGMNFFWRYRMRVKTGPSTYTVRFDDRMFKISDTVVLNEATMYWFGIRVGKVLITFRKQPAV
jgi:hypothetical protein